ncbi:ankyrin repeat domain-containing protein 10-like isoform X1 [Asterias rubens]|uniref:ankyrin repeat domain-containing protein 10-like isoform X1 n=1 Tax=Asterias rubens TaxID=7604 RepID=UPI001455370D|nr:ankyrin repeat domain-containing protein 10-like isoform X1 [Asterias rubens]
MMEQSPALGFWDKSSEDHLRIRFPVHRACRDGDTGALSALLAHGEYDLYTEDQFYGWTPAHWSAYHGKLGCLQLLVTAGVNFDVATQRFHQTPAHVAAFGNQPHCLMWLIRSGASVNAQDYLGETPTHKAARCGGIECLGILKANGAIFRTTNNNGHLPKDLALSCSHELCAHYIQQVDGVPRSTNGFSSGHLGRKRGTEDSTNGDLKKARTENGASAFQEDLNGTENMEMNLGSVEESYKAPCGQESWSSGQQSSFGQVSRSGQELCVGQQLGFGEQSRNGQQQPYNGQQFHHGSNGQQSHNGSNGQQSHNGQQSCMDQQLSNGQEANISHQPSQSCNGQQSYIGQQGSLDPPNVARSGPSKGQARSESGDYLTHCHIPKQLKSAKCRALMGHYL